MRYKYCNNSYTLLFTRQSKGGFFIIYSLNVNGPKPRSSPTTGFTSVMKMAMGNEEKQGDAVQKLMSTIDVSAAHNAAQPHLGGNIDLKQKVTGMPRLVIWVNHCDHPDFVKICRIIDIKSHRLRNAVTNSTFS